MKKFIAILIMLIFLTSNAAALCPKIANEVNCNECLKCKAAGYTSCPTCAACTNKNITSTCKKCTRCNTGCNVTEDSNATDSLNTNFTITKCSNKYYCRGATERVTSGDAKVDYTVLGTDDPYTFQFKDLSKGDITYMRWNFGDGTAMQGSTITEELKNPVHKFKKPGHYTGCLTIKVKGIQGHLWVHKDLKFTVSDKPCTKCVKKCTKCVNN